MENLSVLMELFNHLNKSNSKTFIEHFDSEAGIIKLSDHLELNVNHLISREDIVSFLGSKMNSKTDPFPSER
jgi:hypothetical protein